MQMDRKKLEKDLEKQEEEEFAEYWKIWNKELQEAEMMEADEERARNWELANYHHMQKAEKHSKLEHDFWKEQIAATRAQALVDQQEKHFYNYAENIISDWQSKGHVKPLILELKGQAKALHKA